MDLEDIDPNEVLIMTTGSQGEDFAALNVASYKRHSTLKLSPEDLLMYSAKVLCLVLQVVACCSDLTYVQEWYIIL